MENRHKLLKCCNPFSKLHSTKCDLRNVTKLMVERLPSLQLKWKICSACRLEVYKLPGPSSSVEVENLGDIQGIADSQDVEFFDRDAALNCLQECLHYLGEPEIQKKRMSDSAYVERELKSIMDAISTKIFNTPNAQEKESNGFLEKFASKLREKYITTQDKGMKCMILTLLPEDWTSTKIMETFPGTTNYMLKKSKQISQEQGILSIRPRKSMDMDTKLRELAIQFYLNDEISRLMPGKKDFVSIKVIVKFFKNSFNNILFQVDGERNHIQKRLLLGNLKEIHQTFKSSHPESKISFSKFASLRPKNCILAGASGTHSVCVCTSHQNIKLMTEAIKSKKWNMSAHSQQYITNYKSCISTMICNPPDTKCFLNNCPQCPGFLPLKEELEKVFEENCVETITYQQWTSTDRSNLETRIENADDFLDAFQKRMTVLIPHSFIAERQGSFLKEIKESLNQNEFLVIMDFAENYSFVIQDEIQSFHWTNSQATIHPFGVYFKNENSNIEHTNLVIISDCLKHNTVLVHLFQRYLIKYLKKKYGVIKKITYFSDGSASQYKNRKNFLNITMHEADFGCPCTWHFFATAHGKSICDGLGGTVKRLATKASLQRPFNHQIISPRLLYEWASENINNINFNFVPEEEYYQEEIYLNERFLRAHRIPSTQKLHTVIPVNEGIVLMKRYSFSSEATKYNLLSGAKLTNTIDEDISGFIIYVKSSTWWLGNIICNDEKHEILKVTTLHPSGPARHFHFPNEPDVQSITKFSVICQINPQINNDVYILTASKIKYITKLIKLRKS